MRIEKTVCDICGANIKDGYQYENEFDSYMRYLVNYKGDEKDTCEKCRKEIDALVLAHIDKMQKGKS